MPDEPDLPPDDPLGLDSADREIRIEKLRENIKEVAGEEMFSGKTADCTPELEEAFLENVLELETHGWVRPFATLLSDGLSLPPPDALDYAAITAKLWDLIHALAGH